jgi:hypothetical protein
MEEYEQLFWPKNYYNYYTEIEEHFQRVRGSPAFRLNTLDWALIEMWKDNGIPLEAVLRGITAAFDKWRARKIRGRDVNSLTYCTQAVVEEAERMQSGGTVQPKTEAAAPFTIAELREYLEFGRKRVQQIEGYESVAAALADILAGLEAQYEHLESLEQNLSALEDKMLAIARTRLSEADLAQGRAELDHQLRPYRGKMSAPQIMMLEKQFLDRWVFERSLLPRVSLFYLR